MGVEVPGMQTEPIFSLPNSQGSPVSVKDLEWHRQSTDSANAQFETASAVKDVVSKP